MEDRTGTMRERERDRGRQIGKSYYYYCYSFLLVPLAGTLTRSHIRPEAASIDIWTALAHVWPRSVKDTVHPSPRRWRIAWLVAEAAARGRLASG